MKFALVTADRSHGVKIRMGGTQGDCTSFMNWCHIFNGIHYSFETLRSEDNSYLKDFDVVMMSGHPQYIEDIIRIAKLLKDSNAVSVFYPEGSTQLYDNSINNFHKEYYEAWNSCDVFSMAEEDKSSYYESFITSETIARFIHVPMSFEMEKGYFLTPSNKKENFVVVYGDNNPNHPLIATACANRLKLPVQTVAFGDEKKVEEVKSLFVDLELRYVTKLAQFNFLQVLKWSVLHIYPTEWIGTARQQIACACVGTPCIGNRDSHTQQRLFPELGVYIYDIDRIIELANRLLTDTAFYEGIVQYALSQLPFYGLRATVDRFLSAVAEARQIKSKVRVAT